jgi:hypothetical protein
LSGRRDRPLLLKPQVRKRADRRRGKMRKLKYLKSRLHLRLTLNHKRNKLQMLIMRSRSIQRRHLLWPRLPNSNKKALKKLIRLNIISLQRFQIRMKSLRKLELIKTLKSRKSLKSNRKVAMSRMIALIRRWPRSKRTMRVKRSPLETRMRSIMKTKSELE